MLRARLYLDGSKVLWSLVQCAQCRVVHKYGIPEVIHGSLICRQCRLVMDLREAMREAAVEWAETHPNDAMVAEDFLDKLIAAEWTRSGVAAEG